ncbi:IclR family transcriptional regulator [Kangiella sp.]|uniref:IclR family transcriptional regulator n=1 Tax=Kangiella sp. TaxID=1920245 RepID=UPI003A91C7F4
MSEVKNNRGTQLLDKALNIIDVIANSTNRPKVKDLVEITGYPKPTLYRILSTLCTRGMLQVDGRDQAYQLGPRFNELSQSFSRYPILKAASDNLLRELSDFARETVSLGVLDGHQVRIIMRHGPYLNEGNLAESSLGLRPLHCTALGKVLLAYSDIRHQSELLDSIELKAVTDSSITESEELKRQLPAIKRQGYAIERNEIIEGVTCVAAPILDKNHKLIAAISISAPTFRTQAQRLQSLIDFLVTNSIQISNQLRKIEFHPTHQYAQDTYLQQWPTKLFEPTQLIKQENSLYIADKYGSNVFRINPDGTDILVWHGDHHITSLAVYSTHAHIAFSNQVFKLALQNGQLSETPIFFTDEDMEILWGYQTNNGDNWLYLRSHHQRKLIQLNEEGELQSEQEIHFPMKSLSVDHLGNMAGLDMENNALVLLADKGRMLTTARILCFLPNEWHGVAQRIFHTPEGNIWVTASNSWSILQCDNIKDESAHFTYYSVPSPTVHSILFENLNEIIVAAGRYQLPYATLSRLQGQSDLYSLTI